MQLVWQISFIAAGMTTLIHCSWDDKFHSLQLVTQISFISAGMTNFIHCGWYDKFYSLQFVWPISFIAAGMTRPRWGFSSTGVLTVYQVRSWITHQVMIIFLGFPIVHYIFIVSSLIINLKTSKNDKIKSKSREGNYE